MGAAGVELGARSVVQTQLGVWGMPDKGPGPDDQRGQELGLTPFGEVNGSWEDALRTALKPTYQLLLATDSDQGAGLP